MESKIILAMIFLGLISPSLVSGASSEYEFSGFTSFFGSSDALFPFNYTGTCEAQFSTFSSYNITAAFTSSASWKSPFNTILTNSPTLNVLNDVTCLNYGQTAFQSIGKSNLDYYETFIDVSQSADEGFINTENKFRCQSSTEWTNFTIDDTETDEGDCFYRIAEGGGDLYTTFKNTLISNYNSCDNLNSWTDQACLVTTSLTGADSTVQYIYPFNSSSGSVIYDIHDATITISVTGGTPSVDYYVDLLNVEIGSVTNLLTESPTGVTGVPISLTDVSGTFALDKDTSYLLIYTFVKNFPGGFTSKIDDIEAPQTDLNVFTYKGDFVCTAFGECQNGTRQQICADSRGIAPDEIRLQFCLDQPLIEVELGFEEFIEQGVYICQKDWFVFTPFCISRLDSFNAKYPVGWTTSTNLDTSGIGRENYIEVTSDYSTVGTRSLRMLFIPQKPDEPVNDGGGGTICGNKTVGASPEVMTTYNETIFVEFNVTFNSPFPAVRFDTKLCNDVPVQYDYTGDFLGINCGKRCYGDCNTTVFGDYRIAVSEIDIVTEFKNTSISFTFLNSVGADNTAEVKTIDASVSTNDFSSGNATINTLNNTVENDTIIFLTARSTVPSRYICLFDSLSNTLAEQLLSNVQVNYSFLITNTTAPVSQLYFDACNTSFTAEIDFIGFSKFDGVNMTIPHRHLDWSGNASSITESKIIDFSNIDLTAGSNYTITIAMNPENPFDSRTHCVYFDNFRVTFETEALAVCESRCEGLDRLIAETGAGHHGTVCTFTRIVNSPLCADSVEFATDLTDLISGEVDFICDGTTAYTIDPNSGLPVADLDNEICIDAINIEDEEDSLVEPIGTIEENLDFILFLVSPLFIYFFIAMVITATVVAFTKHWEPGAMAFGFMLLVGSLVKAPGTDISIIPEWVTLTMILAVVLLFFSKFSKQVTGGGNN